MRKVYKLFVMPLFLLSAIVGTSLSTYAQNEVQNVISERKERGLEWIVRAGVSFNNLTGSAMKEFKKDVKYLERELNVILGSDESLSMGYKNNFGYDLSFGFHNYMGKSNFYWGMQLGLGTRGGASEFIIENRNEQLMGTPYAQPYYIKSSLNTYNVKYTPIEIGCKLPLSNYFSIEMHVGIYGTYDFYGSSTDRIKEYQEKEIVYKSNISKNTDIHLFEWGLQLGGGIWFQHVSINFTWQRGLSTFIESSDYPDKNFNSSNAIVSLGYAF